MELLLEKGMTITAQLDEITQKINTILGDEEEQQAFRTLILDMSTLLQYMNTMITERGDDMDTIVVDLRATLERMSSILETVDKGDGTLGQLITNDELYNEMRDFVQEIKMHPWRLLKRDTTEKKNIFSFLMTGAGRAGKHGKKKADFLV